MEFTIQKSVFEEVLNQSTRFTSSRLSANQVLQGVYIKTEQKELLIITTNLNDFYTTRVPAAIKSGGAGVYDLRKLVEFIHFLPEGEIKFEEKEGAAIVTSGKTKGTINIYAVEEFPLPPEKTGEAIILNKTTQNIILKTAYSSSKDEARPILTGTLLSNKNNKTVFVTTDGFRLSLGTVEEIGKLDNTVMPTWILDEAVKLSKGEDIVINKQKDENVINILIGKTTIYTRLLAGDFPPYERVVPEKYKTRLIIKATDLANGIRIASVFAKDQADVVILNISPKELFITPKGQKREDSAVFIETEEISGPALSIAFNYKYILDFLSHADSEVVILEFSQSTAPGVFKEKGNNDYIHIIMPLRTEETTTE